MTGLFSVQRKADGTTSFARRMIGKLHALPVLALASGMLVLGAQAASASYPVQTQPLTVAPGSPAPAPGASVTIEGSGFQPGAQVSIDVHSTVVHLATVTADAAGSIKATVTIPATLSGGSHELTASGPAPGGGTNTLTDSFTVAGGSLPFTGTPALLIGVVGGIAVVAGAVLFVYSRRRRVTA